MIDYYEINDLVALQASPYWFEIGAKDGTIQDLDLLSISVLIIDEITNALDEFEVGNIDIIDVTTLTEERRQMENNAAYIVYDDKLSEIYSFIAININSPLLGGENYLLFMNKIPGKEEYTIGMALRKAIFYAINRVQLNDIFHNGEHYIYDSPIHPSLGYWLYDGYPFYTHNMTLAEIWVSAAVYTRLFYDEQSSAT